jgi:GTP-binding protein EngB required for normal cell division
VVNHRADLWNLRTSHTSLRKELTKQLLMKDGKKKLARVSPSPGETKTERLFKYQHQDSMLKV